MFSTKRLKKKSQSVDITTQGYSGTLVKDNQLSLTDRLVPSVARTTVSGEENATNSQTVTSPRRSDLKRFHTIDPGQKKDVRRTPFRRPRGTREYRVESRDTLNHIALKFDTTPNELVQLNKLFSRAVVPGQALYVPDPSHISSAESSPSLSPISPLSPTSSEADLEKLTTDSDGAPQKDMSVPQAHIAPSSTRMVSSTSEEEEAALTEKFLKINCKYITDGKGVISGVLLVTPSNVMFEPQRSDPSVQKHGCEEFGIICPLDEITFAAAYREITDRKIRESIPVDLEAVLPGCEPGHLKRNPHSNMETVHSRHTDNNGGSTVPHHTEDPSSEEVFTESELSPTRTDVVPSDELRHDKSSASSSKAAQPNKPEANSGPQEDAQRMPPDGEVDDGGSCTMKSREVTQNVGTDVGSQASEQKKELEGSQCAAAGVGPQGAVESQDTAQGRAANGEKQRQQTHKFLCLRVGRPMKKTFIPHASASMQQYAQRGRKHDYWFAVPQDRSDHLYQFFIQWSPDTYEKVGQGREPGFIVVKRNEQSEALEEKKMDISMKEWEVVSGAEYQRRVDALNSEDLHSLCKRLQITTKEELSTTYGGPTKSDPELDALRPTLSEPSTLLQVEQIEKLVKSLPPRTVGYPWSLVFSTSKHGMSIKTLYRAMQAQDSPVLMVIKDSEGQLFGALASEPFKVSDGFYGTGETFLFTFCPDFEVFKWTGDNMFFIKGDVDSLALGGGGGEFGLWLDGDLYHGRTNSCKTFGNPMLSTKEDFFVQDIEIWSFE